MTMGVLPMLATVALSLPVSDMAGHRIEECKVLVGQEGRLTLMCLGQEPILLDHQIKLKEPLPKIRINREGAKVTKIEIRPARELDWRPVAWLIVSVGAVMWGGSKWQQNTEWDQSVSPWRP